MKKTYREELNGFLEQRVQCHLTSMDIDQRPSHGNLSDLTEIVHQVQVDAIDAEQPLYIREVNGCPLASPILDALVRGVICRRRRTEPKEMVECRLQLSRMSVD